MRRLVPWLGVLLAQCGVPETGTVSIVSELAFPEAHCPVTDQLQLVNTRRARATVTSVRKVSGAPVRIVPFLDEANPVFTLTLPAELLPGPTAIPVTFSPPRDDTTMASFPTDLVLEVAGTTLAVRLDGVRKAGDPLAQVPQFVDLLGVKVGSPIAETPMPSAPLQLIGASDAFFVMGASLIAAPPSNGDYRAEVETRLDCHSATTGYLVTGVPAVLTATPEVVDFGWVPAGLSRTRTVTLRNFTRSPSRFLSSIAPQAAFSIVSAAEGVVGSARRDAGQPIDPGTATIDLRFSPASPGFSSLTVAINSGQAPLNVLLQGRQGGPDIDAPGRVDFGAITALATQSLTVRNLGQRVQPADPTANLHLGLDGMPPYFELVYVSGVSGNVTVTLESQYDPARGVDSLADVRFRVEATPGTSDHDLRIFSDDVDEPVVTVRISVK